MVSPDAELSGHWPCVSADVFWPVFLALAAAVLWAGAGLIVLIHDQAERDFRAAARCVTADNVYLPTE